MHYDSTHGMSLPNNGAAQTAVYRSIYTYNVIMKTQHNVPIVPGNITKMASNGRVFSVLANERDD